MRGAVAVHTPITRVDLVCIGASFLFVGMASDVRALVLAGVMFAAYGIITGALRYMSERA